MGWPRFRTPHPSGNHLPNSLETSHVHICGRRNTHEFKDKVVRLQNYVVSTRGESLSWWRSCVVHAVDLAEKNRHGTTNIENQLGKTEVHEDISV